MTLSEAVHLEVWLSGCNLVGWLVPDNWAAPSPTSPATVAITAYRRRSRKCPGAAVCRDIATATNCDTARA